MSKTHLRLFTAVALLVLGLVPARTSLAGAADSDMTIMSFNIRYGTANDGENSWPLRRSLLLETLREEAADVIGIQEALDEQISEIIASMPEYAVLGVGRDDGARKGEYAAILFRLERYRVAESGTFWLSDTPEIVASKTWGNSITRICTWARLIDQSGRGFWLYNVHLDHQSQPSRERSTELLLRRLAVRSFLAEPVIITGDFNVGERNPAILTLTGSVQDAEGPPFLDTFRLLHPAESRVGTFTGFKWGALDGDKIDYVLVQPGTQVLSASIVRTSRDQRYPSDHFPVTARIRLPPQ